MTTRSTRATAGFALVLMVGLAACGSSSGSKGGSDSGSSSNTSSSGSSTKKSIDVCKIITAADAEKVFGGPAKEQAPAGTEGLASGVCIYKEDGTGIRVNLLQIRVYPGPQFYGEKVFPNAKSIDVDGADKAFENVKTTGAGAASIDIQFVKDDQTGTINYVATGGADPSTALPALEDIANKLANGI